MVYSSSSYTPTYYTSLHDSITTLCKSIIPFSFKKRRLPAIVAAEQRLSKQQSDNLKWQQDSFHQILKLMGLCKEGILPEEEVSAFRCHLLDTLVASPAEHEQSLILRDKLVFLQELLYANCISEEEYHSSKRPLLQRLAVQGAEIEARDVVVAAPKQSSEEEWSVIDLKDEQRMLTRESSSSKTKSKPSSAMKQIKGAASMFGFTSSSDRTVKGKENKALIDPEVCFSRENPFWDSHLMERESETRSILMAESLPLGSMEVGSRSEGEKAKRKPFRNLFQREQRDGHESSNLGQSSEENLSKVAKKNWGFDGFKKWKRSDPEDETAPLPLAERSDDEAFKLVDNAIGEGPNTKHMKKNLHSNGSPSDFFIDKVLGEKIKKELSRIQIELNAKNPNLQFSNDQIEAISTRLPVDNADLKNFFPKSWCDRYGDVVLDVVRKEFKEHVGEMGSLRKQNSSRRWAKFDDEENSHPNHFASHRQGKYGTMKDDHTYSGLKQSSEAAFLQDQNPFWSSKLGSSTPN